MFSRSKQYEIIARLQMKAEEAFKQDNDDDVIKYVDLYNYLTNNGDLVDQKTFTSNVSACIAALGDDLTAEELYLAAYYKAQPVAIGNGQTLDASDLDESTLYKE